MAAALFLGIVTACTLQGPADAAYKPPLDDLAPTPSAKVTGQVLTPSGRIAVHLLVVLRSERTDSTCTPGPSFGGLPGRPSTTTAVDSRGDYRAELWFFGPMGSTQCISLYGIREGVEVRLSAHPTAVVMESAGSLRPDWLLDGVIPAGPGRWERDSLAGPPIEFP